MRLLLGTVLVAFSSSVASAQGEGYSDIAAQFSITGAEAVDPSPDAPKDRVALFLSGAGAKKIYDSIPNAAFAGDACEAGLKLKKSGGLICENHSGRSYSCSVSILFENGQTRPFGAC